MADRATYSHLSDPMPTGLQFLAQYANRLGQLFDAAMLPLTAVGGTANAVTAALDPPLLAGLVDGMRFAVTWASANSGAATLALNGGSAVPVVDAQGAALPAGAIAAGRRDLLEYLGGAFRILTMPSGTGTAGPARWVYAASATWTNPGGHADDRPVLLTAWGGGGGGGGLNGGGGGGGRCSRLWLRYADLPSSLTITIGAGGLAEAAGGTTTIGALLTAWGGGAGATNAGGGAGGGGYAAGLNGGSTGGVGRLGAGSGGDPGATGGVQGTAGGDATSEGGGGGGGGGAGSGSASGAGGDADLGGGGGGGAGSGIRAGGSSRLGGDGGQGGNAGGSATAGSAPGGGGGAGTPGMPGGRGQAEIWIFG